MSNLNSKIKISVIGIEGQAKRHINTIKNTKSLILKNVYHPEKTKVISYPNLPITNKLDDCLESDGIILASPTNYHYTQLNELKNFPGYILLEKPASDNEDEINNLLNLPESLKKRILVNFNFQLNPVAKKILQILENGLIGEQISFIFETNHGGTFKKSWDNSWRTNQYSNSIYTVGIHYLHWLVCKLSLNISNVNTFSIQDKIDSGVINISFKENIFGTILTSYSSALKINISITGTDGYILYDGNNLSLYHPRNTFDKDGNFNFPPLKEQFNIPWKSAYNESIEKSFNLFVNHIYRKKLFPVENFENDVKIFNQLI
ncbi:MAG: hypothetical protein CL748_01735 [Chloroflexi bacterium]|nr:hypothetical protein [Chloroflexota bacterium]